MPIALMKIKKGFKSIIVLSLVTLLSCSNSDSTKKLKIGVLLGSQYSWQNDIKMGIESYLSRASRLDGCLHPKEVELLYRDTLSTQEKTAIATLELIQNDKVQAILGPNISDTALVAAKIAESTQTPLISITSTHSDLTTDNSFVFQFAVNNRIQARMLSDFLINKQQFKTAAVIYKATSDYSRGYKNEFVEVFERLGGRITDEVGYIESPLLPNNTIESIKNNEPDFILMPNFSDEVILIVRQLKNQNIQSVFVGSDSWETENLKTIADFQGSLIIDHWYSDSYEDIDMLEKFTENVSPLAFDVTKLLWRVICETPNSDRLSIKNNLSATTNFRGITGTVEEFIGGKVVRDMVIVKIHNKESELNDILSVKKYIDHYE